LELDFFGDDIDNLEDFGIELFVFLGIGESDLMLRKMRGKREEEPERRS